MKKKNNKLHPFFKIGMQLLRKATHVLIAHWKIDLCAAILLLVLSTYFEPIKDFVVDLVKHHEKKITQSTVPHRVFTETRLNEDISQLNFNSRSMTILGYSFNVTVVKTISYSIKLDEPFRVMVKAEATGKFPDINNIDIHGAISIKIYNNRKVEIIKYSPVYYKIKSNSWSQEPVGNDALYMADLGPGEYNIVIEGVFYGGISEPKLKTIIDVLVFRPP